MPAETAARAVFSESVPFRPCVRWKRIDILPRAEARGFLAN